MKIENIKNKLMDELNKLIKQKKNLKQEDPFSDPNRVDENSVEDDLDEQIGHFDAEVKINFTAKRIIELRKALSRLKIGKYGVCEDCGKMIDTRRLHVKPEAVICIKCETEKES